MCIRDRYKRCSFQGDCEHLIVGLFTRAMCWLSFSFLFCWDAQYSKLWWLSFSFVWFFFSGDAWWSKICWFLFLRVWDVVGTPEKQLCPLPFWMLDLGVMWILLGSGLCVLSCTYYIIILHTLVGIFRLEFKRWMGFFFSYVVC